MAKFVIITDSSSDLTEEWRKKYDVDYIPLRFFYKGEEYDGDPDWKAVSLKEFCDYMRAGNRIMTSQISAVACKEKFESYLKEGYDILSISCSGALSSSISVCIRTAEELKAEYPDRKVICIDGTISSAGLGILCIRASELRAEGKSLEETASWVEENKKYVHQEGTVEKLTYLKQAGRISVASAFFGGLLNIKPIIMSDLSGHNVAVEKVKGRRASFIRMAERVKEKYRPEAYADIFVHHMDCEEEALVLKEEIIKQVGVKEENVHIGKINAAVGASVGPGMLGVYYYGTEITYDSQVK